jgi:hypothetical protein
VILQDEPSQDRASESEQRIIPAAAYVRMSTDHQRYSTANQSRDRTLRGHTWLQDCPAVRG